MYESERIIELLLDFGDNSSWDMDQYDGKIMAWVPINIKSALVSTPTLIHLYINYRAKNDKNYRCNEPHAGTSGW